jgi:hypothetical protein
MADQLIDLAERFLRRLEKSLLPLPALIRESILLHYRERLAIHSRRGFQATREALGELGDPEAIAARHLAAERESPTPDPSASRAIVPMPAHRNLPAILGQIASSPGELLADIRASIAATRHDLVAICGVMLATFTGLGSLASYHALDGGGFEEAMWDCLFAALVVSVTMTALFRAALKRTDLVWEIGQPLLTVFAATVAIVFASAGAGFLLFLPLSPILGALGAGPSAIRAAGAATDALATVAVVGLSLRALPWVAAKAIGRGDLGLKSVWQRGWRRRASLLKGWALFVLPLFALHTLLGNAALAVPNFGGFQLAISGLDAIVITLMMLMGGMLTCIGYRWAVGEAIPEPLPFAAGIPPAAHVRAARERLSIAHDATRFRSKAPLLGGLPFTGLESRDAGL